MNASQLNLARKWRSTNFNEIVGQSISIRILKNSLFLAHFFPVYLFSGQRGCGKTSTARVFAAALNCQKLSAFQSDPQKIVVPCQECDSCVAMKLAKHPDFIEIDAASYTGVDNVRAIIESCVLSPILGSKKIYLIDEAHMLSKAAFNAFLKILEEPPKTALFILATTEPEKIIDTVRSRCFQLFFPALDRDALCNYLADICTKENIVFTDEALRIIAKESEGSVRDALNILEQARFSSERVDEKNILRILGHLDDAQIVMIIRHVFFSNEKDLLTFLQKIQLQTYVLTPIWNRMIEYARAMLWYKHGVQPSEFMHIITDLFIDFVQNIAVQQIYDLLKSLCVIQDLLGKTKTEHAVLELALLEICSKKKSLDSDITQASKKKTVIEDVVVQIEETKGNEKNGDVSTWSAFMDEIKKIDDPLVFSIFSQATQHLYDKQLAKLTIFFPQDLAFFEDTINGSKKSWLPVVQRLFGLSSCVDILFTGLREPSFSQKENLGIKKTTENFVPIKQSKPQGLQKENFNPNHGFQKSNAMFKQPKVQEKSIDVSDEAMWKLTHKILSVFPGKVTQV